MTRTILLLSLAALAATACAISEQEASRLTALNFSVELHDMQCTMSTCDYPDDGCSGSYV